MHPATGTAGVRLPGRKGERTQVSQTCGTTPPARLTLRDGLAAHPGTPVALERPGGYWTPGYSGLEDGCTLLLGTAAPLAQGPGRQTDGQDCAWIAHRLEGGLLRGSCGPPPAIRARRALPRDRQARLQDRTRAANRLHQGWEDAGGKLATVVSASLGGSGRALLTARGAGTTAPPGLADLARGKLRAKRPALRQALPGRFRGPPAFLVTHLLAPRDSLDETLATLRTEIASPRLPCARAGGRVPTIPGGKQRTVEKLVAAIGVDMPRCRTAGPLTRWAGVCPGTTASAGKRRRGRPRQGDRGLQIPLREAALAALRGQGSALGARSRRIGRPRGHQLAIVAVARAILASVWPRLTPGSTYAERGADSIDRRDKTQVTRRYVRLLENLGHRVTLEPAPLAA